MFMVWLGRVIYVLENSLTLFAENVFTPKVETDMIR